MTIQQALAKLLDHNDLAPEQMEAVMNQIMQGQATPSQIAGFVIALRMKGESVNELAAAAKVMRSLSNKVEVGLEDLVDTCGTGGDGSKTFNISTASAIVAASAGVNIAKHGNRSVSSKSGSADVLEALGVKLDLEPKQVAQCVKDIGIGFMFAPMHHSSMKHAAIPRKELAVRTLFNLLGPLTNPAGAKRQVMGVFDHAWLEPIANVLQALGAVKALVVHSDDGLDELSVATTSQVCELNHQQIKAYQVRPEELGISYSSLDEIQVEDVSESAAIINSIFDGQPGAAADIVALNAGAAIYVADKAESLEIGVGMAQDRIRSGAAKEKLDQLIMFTHQ
ncbi:MAG: anthranilate phosphoribosyltransferase [Pseudomonadota bacterium]